MSQKQYTPTTFIIMSQKQYTPTTFVTLESCVVQPLLLHFSGIDCFQIIQILMLFNESLNILFDLRYFETKTKTVNGTLTLVHTEMGANWTYNLVYMDILYYILSFVLPLVLLAFFNAKLILAYRAFQRKRAALRTTSRTQHRLDTHEQNVTLIMIVVILVFMVCNVPGKVVQIALTYRKQDCLTAEFFAREISIVLEVFSSSVNFAIYWVFLKRFRVSIRSHACLSNRNGAATSTHPQASSFQDFRSNIIVADKKSTSPLQPSKSGDAVRTDAV